MQPVHLELLERLGAGRMSHSRGTLLAHLVATHDLLQAWGNAPEVCVAGGFHSIYGTYVYDGRAASLDERPAVRRVIGERAEQLVYLFCVTDRSEFYGQVESERPRLHDPVRDEAVAIDRATLADLIEIEAANVLEQLPRRSARKAARAARWYGDAFARTHDLLSPAARRAVVECFARVLAETPGGVSAPAAGA